MNTNSLLNESAGFNKKMSEEAKGLVAKWEKTGLLEGIDAEFERSSIATLLENQAKQLVSEASSTGTSANSEEWAGVALPLVRRIFCRNRCKRIRFCTTYEPSFRSCILLRLQVWYCSARI